MGRPGSTDPSVLAWLEAPGHHLLSLQDERYPPLLREIPDPPRRLYVDGDPGVLNRLQIAMVGSRNPTRSGRETARLFARSLAAAGVTITSGLARGIDGAAHRGALAGAGATVAVVGTGVDRVYPAAHESLAQEIRGRGALVSEFPLGTAPFAGNFPKRNRIISGLSLGVVVVEANSRSGSLITAKFAAEQGRELFAVPGSIHSPQSRGCHQLIREGAKLVETVEEIFEEVSALARFQLAETRDHRDPGKDPAPGLGKDERRLLEELDDVPCAVDVLVEATGLPVERIAAMLVELELRSLVARESDGYVRCRGGLPGPIR